MAELDLRRWAVIDARANRPMWEMLAPGAGYISAETLQARRHREKLDWTNDDDVPLPQNPQFVIIHVDCDIIANPPSTIAGINWAIRLREEAERFRCPILLLSFRRRDYAEARDLEYFGNDLLYRFLAEEWQVRWERLPQSAQDLEELAKIAIAAIEEKEPTDSDWHELGRILCQGQIERIHRRYQHGRGGFTTAIWLLAGARRQGAISLTDAKYVLDEIEREHMASTAGDMATMAPAGDYDFALVHRYLHLLEPPAIARPKAIEIQQQRNLLLIDDEYGWQPTLRALLAPDWSVQQVRTGSEVPAELNRYQLILVDENLGAISGLDVIKQIREKNPLVPVVLFSSNRDPLVTTEALEHCGASDVFLKQSSDSDDRGMGEYYETFAATISDYKNTDPAALSHLLKALHLAKLLSTQHAPAEMNEEQQACFLGAIGGLQQAISLATIAAGAGGTDQNPGTTLRATIIQLEEGLRDFAAACGAERNTNTDTMLKAAGFDREKNGWLGRFYNTAQKCRHGADYSDAEMASRYCMSFAELMQRRWFGHVRPADVATIPWNENLRQPTAKEGKTHEQRSQLGALRFLLGYYIANGADAQEMAQFWRAADGKPVKAIIQDIERSVQFYGMPDSHPDRSTILVTDDSAHKDGWMDVLVATLRPCGYTICHFAKSANELKDKIAKVDSAHSTLLLDLHLPKEQDGNMSEQIGRDCIELIRHEQPEIPVIVFSATENAYWARRCLRGKPGSEMLSRAQGYFPKTGSSLPTDQKLSSGEFFCQYYDALQELLNIPGPTMSHEAVVDTCERLGNAKRYACLDELHDAVWRDEFRNSLEDRLGIEHDSKLLSEFISRYVRSQLYMVCKLAWAVEDPYQRLLFQRMFPSEDQFDKGSQSLAIVPAGLIEGLAKIIIAVAWGEWQGGLHSWGDARTKYFGPNRSYFNKVTSTDFEKARKSIYEWRGQKRYREEKEGYDGTLRRGAVLDGYCRAVEILCEELIEVAEKVKHGETRSGEHKAKPIPKIDRLSMEPEVGGRLQGIVVNMEPFGAFVDVGAGARKHGFLHINEISHDRIHHPDERLSIGQRIEVLVTEVDKEKNRLAVSLKRLQPNPNPWETYKRGKRTMGRVIALFDYGALVQLELGMRGLVRAKDNPLWRSAVSMGQSVEVEILATDPDRRRISLRLCKKT